MSVSYDPNANYPELTAEVFERVFGETRIAVTPHSTDFLNRTGLTLDQTAKAEAIIAIARAMLVEEFDAEQINEFSLNEFGIEDGDKETVVSMGITFFLEAVNDVKSLNTDPSTLRVSPWLGNDNPV